MRSALWCVTTARTASSRDTCPPSAAVVTANGTSPKSPALALPPTKGHMHRNLKTTTSTTTPRGDSTSQPDMSTAGPLDKKNMTTDPFKYPMAQAWNMLFCDRQLKNNKQYQVPFECFTTISAILFFLKRHI